MKDPDVALDLGPAPKTEPLLGLGGDLEDLLGVAPWALISGVALVVVVVAAVLYRIL